MSNKTHSERETAHKRQVANGYGWLRFEPELEAGFRKFYLDIMKTRVTSCMVILAFTFVTAVFTNWTGLKALQLPPHIAKWLVAILLPAALFLAASLLFRSLYLKLWLVSTPVILTLVGCIGAFAVAELSATGNSQAFVIMLVGSIGAFLLFGMLFWQIAVVGCASLMVYLFSLQQHGAALATVQFEGSILAMLMAMALVFYYGLEYSLRRAYLRSLLLRDLGNLDALTGLKNRRAFDKALHSLWQQGHRDQKALGLLLIDVDHFKDYNDQYGHQAGDRCLSAIAEELTKAERRPLDIAARIGGEEFALLLYGCSKEHVNAVAEDLLTAIRQRAMPHARSAAANVVTASVGAAQVIPILGRSPESLQQCADEALYQAKSRGRNCVIWQDGDYENVVTGAFRLERRSHE